MKTLLFDDAIENLCEKNTDYQNALGMLSDEPNAAEMKAFGKIEDKYLKSLTATVIFLVREIETVKERHKSQDCLIKNDENTCDSFAPCSTDDPLENKYKLIVGKYTKSFCRSVGIDEQNYVFALVPWKNAGTVYWFKAKQRKIFYSMESLAAEIADLQDFMKHFPAVAKRESLQQYLETLEEGANRMFEKMVSPYMESEHND